MVTTEDAVLAMRHAVQEHGDEHCRLGRPGSIGSDGCGNDFALAIGEVDSNAEGPVVSLEYGTENIGKVARTFSEFVANHLAKECTRLDCTSPIRRTNFKSVLED
ncbi:MAG: SMI1/KNR4 family protein [Gemmataceae bacterium]|nr:SMI1/KNR4 family protein [Gemmataceae bacterium]